MKMREQKYIFTDVDGVLLDWLDSFRRYMKDKGFVENPDFNFDVWDIDDLYQEVDDVTRYIREFNECPSIGELSPLPQSRHYVRLLVEKHDYKFIAITSVSSSDYTFDLRKQNLERFFGDETFASINCLDIGESKYEMLAELAKQHPNSFWIEDNYDNYVDGEIAGFRSILMLHEHNMSEEATTVAGGWEDVYEIITGEVA